LIEEGALRHPGCRAKPWTSHGSRDQGDNDEKKDSFLSDVVDRCAFVGIAWKSPGGGGG
jgi:hypothetical protein